jgi:hypothetical protein
VAIHLFLFRAGVAEAGNWAGIVVGSMLCISSSAQGGGAGTHRWSLRTLSLSALPGAITEQLWAL